MTSNQDLQEGLTDNVSRLSYLKPSSIFVWKMFEKMFEKMFDLKIEKINTYHEIEKMFEKKIEFEQI